MALNLALKYRLLLSKLLAQLLENRLLISELLCLLWIGGRHELLLQFLTLAK